MLSDYYRRYVNQGATERQAMRLLRVVTVGWGAAGTGAAIAMTQVRGALDAWWALAGIFGGGTLGLFLLGFFSKQTGNRAAQAGVSIGVALILWMTLSPKIASIPPGWRSPFHEFLIIVFGTAAVLAVGLAAGRAASMRRHRRPLP